MRDTVLEELSANDSGKAKMKRQASRPLSKGKYSRLDADISSMQRDSTTYCDEPADTAHYQAWRSNFDLASYKPAVDQLVTDNAFMAELQARIVPVIVEYDAFWTRYFYRLHLLEVIYSCNLLCWVKDYVLPSSGLLCNHQNHLCLYSASAIARPELTFLCRLCYGWHALIMQH